MFWFAFQHHILELILSAAIKCKLSPTFRQNDSFFSKFRDCFNGLSKNNMESIIEKAAEKIRTIAPKDDVTYKFYDFTCTFMKNFNSYHSIQRGDYLELAKIVQVSIMIDFIYIYIYIYIYASTSHTAMYIYIYIGEV